MMTRAQLEALRPELAAWNRGVVLARREYAAHPFVMCARSRCWNPHPDGSLFCQPCEVASDLAREKRRAVSQGRREDPIHTSPSVLTAGHWTQGRHGIQRWVPELTIVPEPVRAPAPGIACAICSATTAEWCRTALGKARAPHDERKGERTCACGAAPMAPKAHRCTPCHLEHRRGIFHARDQRRRDALREAS